MDAAWIYGKDATLLPPTVAPYVAWTGKPRPRAEDCGPHHLEPPVTTPTTISGALVREALAVLGIDDDVAEVHIDFRRVTIVRHRVDADGLLAVTYNGDILRETVEIALVSP